MRCSVFIDCFTESLDSLIFCLTNILIDNAALVSLLRMAAISLHHSGTLIFLPILGNSATTFDFYYD